MIFEFNRPASILPFCILHPGYNRYSAVNPVSMATRSRGTEEIESRVLGALCAGPLSLDDRSEALRSLANYNWILPDHRVIYEALRRSRQRNLAALRENIRAEITRLGFPDIDVEPFFAPCTLTKAEIVELASALLSAGRTPANQK